MGQCWKNQTKTAGQWSLLKMILRVIYFKNHLFTAVYDTLFVVLAQKLSWKVTQNQKLRDVFFQHYEFFHSICLTVSWTKVVIQKQRAYTGEIENLVQRTLKLCCLQEKPALSQFHKSSSMDHISRIWWLLLSDFMQRCIFIQNSHWFLDSAWISRLSSCRILLKLP